MCFTEKVGRCVAKAERGCKDPVTLLSLSSELSCPSQLSHLITWAFSPSCLSPLSILLLHPPSPRLSCEVPKIHTQTWAVTPAASFAGKPRGCSEKLCHVPVLIPAMPMPGPCLCLLPLLLRSLRPSPCSLQLLSTHHKVT